MTLRVLIADDEPVARRRIKRLLRLEPDVELVAEAGDGRAAIEAIRRHAPDLVFLDIQMPELDGFGVIEALRDRRLALSGVGGPAVVFVTAFDGYAVRAFEVHALDYLLKPFTRDRFHAAIARAWQRLDHDGENLEARLSALVEQLAARRPYLSRIPIRVTGGVRVVDAVDIDWIAAADNYVTLRAGGREFLLRDTMDHLERELDPERFVRIHRSTIVQLERIRELKPSFHGDFAVILHDGTRLTLSRTYRERVAQAFGRRL